MTSKKTTRRALLSSMIALLLCVSMLVGSTFAWFTDEVTSTGNIIKSGTLDVEMYYGDSADAITNNASTGTIFDYQYWEPGYTQVKYVKIANEGDLALKYQLNIIPEMLPAQGDVNLADVIDVYMLPADANVSRDAIKAATPVGTLTDMMAKTAGAAYGVILPTEGATDVKLNPEDAAIAVTGSATYCIVLKMREEAGNEYQNLSVGEGFKVQLLATQYTWENDSFDNMYDDESGYNALPNATVSKVKGEGLSTYLIKDIINDGIGSGVMTNLTLDTAYSFKGEPVETAEKNPYADWFVDFFVSLDKVPADGLVLSGQYGQWDQDNWYAFYIPTDGLVEAGEFYPLLGTVTGGGVSNWTYVDICSGVGTFNCGAVDLKGLNKGTTLTVELRLINPEDTTETITVKSVEYTFGEHPYSVFNADELAEAVANGITNLYLMDGEYDVYGCGGKTLTISGSENAVIKLYNEGEDGCDYAFGSSVGVGNVTFNGVTIDTTSNTGNYKGFAYMKGTFNNCNFVGAYSLNNSTDFEFNNCTFDFKNGYFWTWGANSVTFNGCTFNGNSKTILAHGYASTVITINDCTFAATEQGFTGSGDNTAAVEIDPAGSNTYTITFTGENTKTASYAGWTRIKDGSTGHIITTP